MHDRDGAADGDRRRFLRYLAASPLLMGLGLDGGVLDGFLANSGTGRPVMDELLQQASTSGAPIKSPGEALRIMDFEGAARAALPPAHFGYMASGVDDDVTLRANSGGFAKFQLRSRRLVDVRKVDTSVTIFGQRWETPILVCPCGSQNAFHAEGEIATARAARAKGHLQLLSGVSTTSVENVIAARGMPVWYQLYPTNDEKVAHAIARRAQAAGCPVLVVTVDLNAGRNLETQLRMQRSDSRQCIQCHTPGIAHSLRRKPMFDGLDMSRATDYGDKSMSWDYLRRLRDAVPKMKLVLKGIVTSEDATLAVRNGVDAIVVSNHGGRADESGRSTIESLPEVTRAVAGRIPVMIDGGFRRGTDIVKAIALGATAVGIGRPYLWGLAAFGQPGVEAVLAMLRRELELAMRQLGAVSLAKITRASVVQSHSQPTT
jgi:4-hydroxymandelate oxidase